MIVETGNNVEGVEYLSLLVHHPGKLPSFFFIFCERFLGFRSHGGGNFNSSNDSR